MTTESTQPADRSLVISLIRLARPHQWTKSAFVLIGPAYGLAAIDLPLSTVITQALAAAIAFALASSGCYVVNDILDVEQDRAHPRKRRRPIASGAVSVRAGVLFTVFLYVAASITVFAIRPEFRVPVGATLFIYVANVLIYSTALKHILIADVMSLSLGFVLRVVGGCAALGISPTIWLLNTTFFLSMFLAFGKRLGERRSLGKEATLTRKVQALYNDNLLEMAVVVTAVATLGGYTAYVQDQSESVRFEDIYSLFLWLPVLPATFGLFRCIVLLEQGKYDDPTELGIRDRPFQLAALVFAVLTVAIIWRYRMG